MYTKRQFCEEVLRDYYGGDIPSEADRDMREILIIFYEILPFFAKKNAFENSNVDGKLYVDGQLIYVKVYELLFDRMRSEKYIQLDTLPIALPKSMGLVSVEPYGVKYTRPFIISQNAQSSLMGSLPGGLLINKCYQEGTQIRCQNTQDNIKKVLVKLAGAPGQPDFDTPVGILGEYLDEAKEKVLTRLRAADDKPKDQVNDGDDQR